MAKKQEKVQAVKSEEPTKAEAADVKKKPQEVPVNQKPVEVEYEEINTKEERPKAKVISEPRSHDFTVRVDGHERQLSADAITVALQRGQKVEIPKGSRYIAPPIFEKSKNCTGCGR